jgi:hypothetical protein
VSAATALSGADLDALEAELREKIGKLDGQRPGLALDAASGDPKAKAAIERVDADLATAEAQLERLTVARAEHERRVEVARTEAEAAKRREALDRARDLGQRRHKAAKSVDRAAAAFVTAVGEWREIAIDQEQALREAGEGNAALTARPTGYLAEAALSKAMLDGGDAVRSIMPPLLVDANHRRPLAESDPVAIHHVLAEESADA